MVHLPSTTNHRGGDGDQGDDGDGGGGTLRDGGTLRRDDLQCDLHRVAYRL